MKPILFPSYETAFTSQGLGALSDAISCVVREERNGEYELTMEYPVGGIHYDEIGDRCIIFARPSPYRNPQPFRIYSVEVNINGIATIHAHHLSYDLSGIAVSPFNATSCATALSGLISHSVVDNPFTAWTDKAVDGTYKLTTPNSFRACLGGQENSILDVYGKGEYEFDTFDIKLHTNRGSDNGVLIAYGKNLTDFNMEKNLENVTTAVYPYWVDAEGNNLVELDDKIIQLYDPSVPIYLKESGGDFLAEVTNKLLVVHGVFDFDNVMVLDLSGEFEEQPSQYELFNRARKYIIDNQLARPRISIDVSFVDLASTEDYKDIAPIEQVDLCDIVTVRFPLIGIEVKAEIVSIETDVLLDRYNSVQIGDARTTLDMTLAQAMLAPTKEELKVGMASAADYINNTHGTFEWIDNGDDTNGGFTIYENNSSSWLRCTAGGIGISEDGGLTYTNAITKAGVVASKLDVQKNGNPLYEVYYDTDDSASEIDMYHPVTNVLVFNQHAGKYDALYDSGGGNYVRSGDKSTEISLVGYDGATGEDAITILHRSAYSNDNTTLRNELSKVQLGKTGTSLTDDASTTVISSTMSMVNGSPVYHNHMGMTHRAENGTNYGVFVLSLQSNNMLPRIELRHPLLNNGNTLDMFPTQVTINGTTMWIFAGY